MKTLIFRLLLLFSVSQMTACEKLIDRILPGPTHNDGKGCRINSITTQLDDYGQVIATVHYDEAKNPVSLTYDREILYQLYSRFMFYDNENRLIRYKVMYDSSYVVEDHRYGYSGDQITSDTNTITATGYTVVVSTFEYDSKKRLIVENRKIIDGEADPDAWPPVIYTYDSNDNLVYDVEYTYDTKVNFRRTNKVWMFIMRNYSRNNLQGATDYNERGLPIRFENSKDDIFFTGELVSIDYACQ